MGGQTERVRLLKIYYNKPHAVDDPMWVIGCIDSNGSIVARHAASNGRVMHGPDELKGRRWRFNIWAQDFYATRVPTLDVLSPEEWATVNDWLIKKGYKKDE